MELQLDRQSLAYILIALLLVAAVTFIARAIYRAPKRVHVRQRMRELAAHRKSMAEQDSAVPDLERNRKE